MTKTTSTAPTSAAIATEKALPIPSDHIEVNRRQVIVDHSPAELVRFERTDGRNSDLLGEHFSTIMDKNGVLKGFTRMDMALTRDALLSRDRTREIAMAFLETYAPDLLSDMKVNWIEAHDETIHVARGDETEAVTITGMKMKCRNLNDGRWFWVIVGADEDVITFERDIVWITFPGHRQTEKWLHDAWLLEHDAAK